MTSPYRPQPGSIPARVIDHLNLTGGTMTRAAIANGFAIEAKNVDGNLASSIKHGLIVRHQAEGMKTCYGLPGSTPGEDAPAPPASMTINSAAQRTAVAERAQKTKKTRAPAVTSDVVDTMHSDSAPVPAPPPPHCCAVGGRGLCAVRAADQCRRDRHDGRGPRAKTAHFSGAGFRPDGVMAGSIIIGLTGLAGAGKDTVADTLVTHAGFRKIAFADALRLEVAGAYRLYSRFGVLSDRSTKEVPLNQLAFRRCDDVLFVERMLEVHSFDEPDFDQDAWETVPRSPRHVLQWWGTEYRRNQNQNYWADQVGMKIAAGIVEGIHRWVITDCRFENEVRGIRSLGGEIWQVMRQGLADLEGGHESQTDGTRFGPEAVLVNGSNITGLMHTTLRMLQHRHGGLVLPDDLEAAA